jgi:hypothetical protein
LLTSGYEDSVRVPDAEAFELLRKPYQREQLAAALHLALSGRRAE